MLAEQYYEAIDQSEQSLDISWCQCGGVGPGGAIWTRSGRKKRSVTVGPFQGENSCEPWPECFSGDFLSKIIPDGKDAKMRKKK